MQILIIFTINFLSNVYILVTFQNYIFLNCIPNKINLLLKINFQEQYRRKRIFKRKSDLPKPKSEQAEIESTLFEYGGLSSTSDDNLNKFEFSQAQEFMDVSFVELKISVNLKLKLWYKLL